MTLLRLRDIFVNMLTIFNGRRRRRTRRYILLR